MCACMYVYDHTFVAIALWHSLLSYHHVAFPPARIPAHALHYCWHKNYLSKYLYPSTITNRGCLQSRGLCFHWNWRTPPPGCLLCDSWRLSRDRGKAASFLSLYFFLSRLFETEVNDISFKCVHWIFQGVQQEGERVEQRLGAAAAMLKWIPSGLFSHQKKAQVPATCHTVTALTMWKSRCPQQPEGYHLTAFGQDHPRSG